MFDSLGSVINDCGAFRA